MTSYTTGGPQIITVATAGVYDLDAFGAQGGNGGQGAGYTSGGLGAEEGGLFTLSAGEQLEIFVGGQGGTYGGGGGTFVFADTGSGFQLILAAGGGGGAGLSNGGNAIAVTAVGPNPDSGQGGGGTASAIYSGSNGGGGGGAGVFANGTTAAGSPSYGGSGGSSTAGSFAGGAGYTVGQNAPGGAGGIGGGGGGGTFGAGGGGGYTGGNAGYGVASSQGSGGTSFSSVTPTHSSVAQTGDGLFTINAVCFASGTLIQTANGDIPVEALAVGDMVVTSSGAHRPIRWLGHRTLDCLNHAKANEVLPIRIARHAFGPNKPTQDLYVSPGHSICVDLLGEVLIPACALVTGSAVAQVEVDQITYWHVELDSHDILVANGLPAESYLDMGNRNFFLENGVVALEEMPDADLSDPTLRSHADFCRPFVGSGPILDAVRLQLRRQAELTGWQLQTPENLGDLHLVVDGTRVNPTVRNLVARFAVPADARDVWLVSSTARPSDVGQGEDYRQLGVRLAELAIDDGFEDRRVISLDDQLLSVGFHPVEGEFRWTEGRAHLPTALWADCQNDFFLRVELERGPLPNWVMPAIVAQTSITPKVKSAA